MKLHSAPASPYGAKVRAVMIEKGLEEKIAVVTSSPVSGENNLFKVNPLARIPALELDDGSALYDSPVICEYLDALGQGPALFPPAGPARWNALRWQAVGDGLMDTLVRWRAEVMRPEGEQSPSFRKRNADITRMTLDAANAEITTMGGHHIGAIALAMALGYLELRFPDMDWKKERAALAAWYEDMKRRPSIAACLPRV